MFAIDRYSKPWIALTPVEQDTLLQTASTTAPGNRPGIPAIGVAGATAGKATIGDHFSNLKGWIAGAYFSSEKGARELGWDGNVFHTELPGARIRTGTPKSRGQGSGGQGSGCAASQHSSRVHRHSQGRTWRSEGAPY